NIACLTADVACAILPGATGGGLAVKAIERGVKQADNVGDLFKWLDTALDVNKADNIADLGQISENTLSKWKSTTFKNEKDSIKYHYEEHVSSRNIDMTIEEYTDKAENLYNRYLTGNLPENAKVIDTKLGDGSAGTKITIGPNSNNEMGIYSKDGKIITYHPKNPNK
ncbi:hypothetical protein HNP92_002014, partial [Methanococcus maripaludis]